MLHTVRRSLYLMLPTAVVAAVAATSACAASPPPSWTNLRVLDCGGETVEASFTPAASSPRSTSSTAATSSSPSTSRWFPGETEPVTTLDVPGFRANIRETVTCTYVDPEGLMITLTGVR